MRTYSQESHADLGLVDDDNAEDMRKGPGGNRDPREPSTHLINEKGPTSMTCPAPADNTSQTWRDLAGQQITQIEWAEVALVDGPEKEATLLGIARDVIDRRRIDAELADVALPPGARTDSEGWGKGLTEDGYSRSLLWREYAAGAVVVAIDGDQQSDGSFTRQISLYAGDGERLDADGARALGAALIEAADALEAPL